MGCNWKLCLLRTQETQRERKTIRDYAKRVRTKMGKDEDYLGTKRLKQICTNL